MNRDEGAYSLSDLLQRAVCIPHSTIVGGGRVRRQRYTWSTLTVGSHYQAACDRTYHGVIVIGHW